MKTLILLISLVALNSVRAANEAQRIYVQLFRSSGEFLVGFGLLHGQESLSTFHPRGGDPFVIRIRPMRHGDAVQVGIRFFRDLSEARSKGRSLDCITVTLDTPTRYLCNGIECVMIASLSNKLPRANQSPNKAPEPTPVAVMPRAISRVTEVKPQNLKRSEARVTPAIGVAHL